MDNGRSWWVTLIEGIVAIVLGLYLLLGGNAAANNVFLVAALYLLLVGIISLFRGVRGTIARYQAIIAIVVGAIFLLLYAIGTLGSWGYNLVAIGLIIVGALGLYSAFFARSGRAFGWGPVLANGLMLLLGIMIFVADSMDFNLQLWVSLILIAIGVIMALWGFFSRDDNDEAEDEPEPEEISADDVVSKIDDAMEDAADDGGE